MENNEKENALERLKQIEIETFKLKKIIENSDKKTIFERINTFEDVCIESGTTLKMFNEQYRDYLDDEKSYVKLKLIAKVLNEGWRPNWNNSNEYKWYPYFNSGSGSGFCFSSTNCLCTNAAAGVGSRLCFKDEKTAEYAGKTFRETYKSLLM